MTDRSTEKVELSAEARKARREYIRRYRQAHPEKIARWNARYWQRLAEQAKAAPDTEAAED